MRLPAGKPNLPAAMAARGETGTTAGIDYRGVEVVAAMREVPGTPWFMVAKIDKAELFAPVNRLKTWMTGLGIALAVFGGGVLLVWLKGIQARHKLIVVQRDAALEREMLIKHFEYLAKYASDIILVADATGRLVEANERALEAYGYTREELLRMKISDLRLPTEDPATLTGQFERLRELGELRYETINRRKDGTAFPVEVSARIIEVQGAKYLHGIARDITARKLAENALRESESRYRLLVESSPFCIHEIDLEGRLQSMNRAGLNMLGLDDAKKVCGMLYLGAVSQQDAERVGALLRDAITHGIPSHFEFAASGDAPRYFKSCFIPIKDASGKVLKLMGITEDVTAQKTAERKIHRLNSLYAAISMANEAILRIGDQGVLFHEICRIAIEYGQFDLAWIGLIDDATRTVKSAASGGAARAFLDGLDVSIDADEPGECDPICMAIRDNRVYICNDLLNSPHTLRLREKSQMHGLRSFAVSPLELGGRVVGTLAVYSGETGYFDNEFANLLADLSGDISLALENFGREEKRKQAEQLLRQQENFIHQVLDTDQNLISVRDGEGKFLLANQAMATMHGMKPQELAGRNAAELFPEREQLDAVLRTDREVIEKRSQIEFIEQSFLGGMNRWLDVTKAPMEQPDGSVHVLDIAVDITANRLAAEKQLKSAAEIEDLYDRAPCGYHSLDEDGIFVRINNT